MTPFETREQKDTALLEEFMNKAEFVQQEVGEEKLQKEIIDGYAVYRIKLPDGRVKSNKEHRLPQFLREEE